MELKEALGGYFIFEADDLDAAIALAADGAGRERGRRDRDPPDPRSGSDPRWRIPGAVGPGPRCADRLPRRLRPRRGGRCRRPSRSPPTAGRRTGSRPRPAYGWSTTGPSGERSTGIRRERTLAARPASWRSPRPWRTRWTRRPSRTSGSSSSSPAATRRWPPTRRSRLTLRTLGGLTTRRDRARVPGARADDGAAAGPGEEEDQGRRGAVPHPAPTICCRTGWPRCSRCVYLIFNEGYSGRNDLAAEAIRSGARWRSLMPDSRRSTALLAMMLLTRLAPGSRAWTPQGELGAARRRGPRSLERRADRRGQAGSGPRTGARRGRPVRPAGGDRRPVHADDEPESTRSRRCTAGSRASPTGRWSRSAAPSRSRRRRRHRARPAASGRAGSATTTATCIPPRGELLSRLGRTADARDAYHGAKARARRRRAPPMKRKLADLLAD